MTLSLLRASLVVSACLLLLGCEEELHPVVPSATSAVHRSRCLEIQTTLADDEHMPQGSALLWVQLDNRCETAVGVDLGAAIVTGYSGDTADETGVPLHLHDPQHRVHIARLDAKRSGSEAVRYDTPKVEPPAADAPKRPPFQRICVDVTRIEGLLQDEDPATGTAVARPAMVVCLNTPGDPSVADQRHSGMREAHDTPAAFGYGEGYGYGNTFGRTWDSTDMPRLRFEAAGTGHSLAIRSMTMHSPTTRYRVADATTPGRVTAGTLYLRLSGFVHGPLYLGVEGDMGLGGAPRTRLRASEPTFVSDDRPAGYFAGSVFSGVTGRLGVFQPFVEVGIGGRVVVLPYDLPTGPDCPAGCRQNVYAAWLAVIPRVGLDVWVHPNVTLGAFASTDGIRGENPMGGLSAGIHFRSLDAR